MELTGAGTAIMVAVAALLWFLYFVPTWIRSREYRDTERTATRLQQTLRIMAETSEVPEQVRIEVSARDAARRERVLRAQERRADVLAARAAAAVRAQTPAMPRTAAAVSWSRSGPAAGPSASELARRRRRRTHRVATALMFVATATIGIQLALALTTGLVPGAWVVFAIGAATGIAGVVVRRRVESRSGAVSIATSAPRVEQPTDVEVADAAPTAAPGWTPVPVPPPLYLSKPEAQPLVPTLRPDELHARLRAAASAAEEAMRAAHAEPEVVPIRPDVVAAAPSRWASMGRVEAPGAAAPDLDEVLRRRRNAG